MQDPPAFEACRTPGVVRETLAEYGALTRAALLAHLPSGEPHKYLSLIHI